MKRTLVTLLLVIVIALPRDIPRYIGPPVVARLCQIFPHLCAR